MTDTEAMNQINAGIRALYANFVERARIALPDDAEHVSTMDFNVMSGQYKLLYQVEMLPIGIRLEAGVSYDGRLARIFNGVMDGDVIPAPGSPVWQ